MKMHTLIISKSYFAHFLTYKLQSNVIYFLNCSLGIGKDDQQSFSVSSQVDRGEDSVTGVHGDSSGRRPRETGLISDSDCCLMGVAFIPVL